MPAGRFSTVEQVRAVLRARAGARGRGAQEVLSGVELEGVLSSTAYHVQLESWTEWREVGGQFVPYLGGALDDARAGRAPTPWELVATPPAPFVEATTALRVPHTAVVEPCPGPCLAGRGTCGSCGGAGRVCCPTCGGAGVVQHTTVLSSTSPDGQPLSELQLRHESCSVCGGATQVPCGACAGEGRGLCSLCGGAARVERFAVVAVRWRLHVDDGALDARGLPLDLLAAAAGELVLDEQAEALAPVSLAGSPGAQAYRGAPRRVRGDVDGLCQELLARHRFQGAKPRRQRLSVLAVPVCEVPYRRRGARGSLWLYGSDDRTYAPGLLA